MAQYWLLKTESGAYSWDDLLNDGTTSWTGVRNFQARNNLKEMKVGDIALFYHSGDERAIVGVAEVVKAHYPDPTSDDGDWVTVDIKPLKEVKRQVPLDLIKTDPGLRTLMILKQSRLSVSPVTPAEYERICKLAGI